MSRKHKLPSWLSILFLPLRQLLIRFFPKLYLSWQYRFITGQQLHLDHPQKFTEKLQYLRYFVYPKDPLVIRGADRIAVREILRSKGLAKYLVPIYGTFDRFEDIGWDKLPKQCVVKCTHASGFQQIIYHKQTIDLNKMRRMFSKWLATDYGAKTLERHYSPIPKKLIVEKYLGIDHSLPIEYKINVFHGKAKSLYVVTGRKHDIRYTHFYIDWTPFPGAQFNDWQEANYPILQPENFQEMVRIAETLGADYPFVRVDLYNLNGKIYFSELTFTPAKGTLKLSDPKVDDLMGGWLHLENR